jgi:hypothetical protein
MLIPDLLSVCDGSAARDPQTLAQETKKAGVKTTFGAQHLKFVSHRLTFQQTFRQRPDCMLIRLPRLVIRQSSPTARSRATGVPLQAL